MSLPVNDPSPADQQLTKIRNIESSVNQGHKVNEDAWMTYWCQTNWSSLLQPAPLSISLLGSILILASNAEDFSLIVDKPKHVPDQQWKYIKFPDSFKASLMQMVNDGYASFGTAHKNMQAIQLDAGQIPDIVRNIVMLLTNGASDEVAAEFPNMINDLKGLAAQCKDNAEGCSQGFHDMANLASELVVACTYKAGKTEQIIQQNKIHITVLDIDEKNTQKMVDATQSSLKIATKAYTDAQDQFKGALDSMPSEWDLIGMDTVQSLTSLAVSAGNAFISQATMRSQLAMEGAGALVDDIDPKKKHEGEKDHDQPDKISSPPPSVPSLQATTDPGASQVPLTLTQANAFKALLTGGPGGKADWDKIHSTDPKQKSGGLYVQTMLDTIEQKLEHGKPISDALIKSIDALLPAINDLVTTAQGGGDDEKAASLLPTVNAEITALQALSQTAILATQNTGAPATGINTAGNPQPPMGKQTAAELAVSSAKHKIDQTKQVLDGARQSYDRINDRLAAQQQDLTRTIGEMTSLNLQDMTFKDMIPVLKQAVGSFTTLRAQISQLVGFFDSIAMLIEECMTPSVGRLVETLSTADEFIVGGTSLKDFTRTLVYQQTMLPLRVSMLAQKVTVVYVEVSDQYILPAQRRVGNMLQFAKSDDPKDKAHLKATLAREQTALQRSTQDASDHIVALIQEDQKTFQKAITTRLADIDKAIKGILPSEAPRNLEKVTQGYVKGVSNQKAQEANKNPMLKTPEELGLM